VAFIGCRSRLIEVLAGAARKKRELRVEEAKRDYWMLMTGDCWD
jgi:hypothetical protein